jgi:quercetin dioxygenase-like cupin family protein
MKKSISAYICLVAVAILFTACGGTPAAQTTSSSLLHNEAQQSAAPAASTTATGQGCQQVQTATPTATPSAQSKAQNSTEKTLATGQVSTLPQGNLFANILSASQSAGSSVVHKHVASFVYEVNGTQTVQMQGGPKQTLNPGDAVFIQNDATHTHTNPGSTTNLWYLIALRPTTVATPTPSLPNQKTVYETPTLPTSVFPKGAYCESLLKTEQQANGRTASQRYSGLELLHVLEGSVKVDVAGQDTKTLKTGESTYVLPNTPVQVSNAGTSVARFLSFDAWPQGQPLREDLAGLPGEVGTPVPAGTTTPVGTAAGTATPVGTATGTATPVGTATGTATPVGTATGTATPTTTPTR